MSEKSCATRRSGSTGFACAHSQFRRGRYDFAKLPHRQHAKLSPCLRLQLLAGTSLLVWLAAIETVGAILQH